MKKILIIIPSIRYGGQEKVAIKTARLLSKKYDVNILVFKRSENEIDASGLDILDCGSASSKIGSFFKRYITASNLKKTRNYNVSISFSPGANIINVMTKKGEQTITSIRGYRSIFSSSGKAKFLMRKADKMICVSQGIAEKVRAYYGMPKDWVQVLYNPYNVEEIKRMSKEDVDDYSFEGITICNVSHLNEVKGLEHLLRAFSIIHKRIPETNLLIIGDGSMRGQLKEMTEMMGLNHNVCFIGYRENPYKYLARSDLYIMTSENEGFPNSLVEAMVFMPVVSVNCETGPLEILSERFDIKIKNKYEVCEYGILTPPIQKTRNYSSYEIEREENIIADAAVRLLNDKELYFKLRETALNRASQFSEETYLNNLLTIIN